MSMVTILGPLNRGVDMSGEALALGATKIRSAVNCSVMDGVVGSRPGFTYRPLGITGCFQGACGYAPSFGLSAQSFAARSASLVTSAGGVLRRNAVSGAAVSSCPEVIEAQDFGRGPVHLYQAENWLIAQSPGRNTHWWDGRGPATASPGMEPEAQWSDPDVPVTRICSELPEANIPECDQFDCDPNACTLVIVEKKVLTATTGFMRISNSGFAEAHITGLSSYPYGAVFTPPVLDIPAGTVRRVDFNVSGVVNLSTTGVKIVVDSTCGSGTLDFFVPPSSSPATCSLEILSLTTISATKFSLTIRNNGTTSATGIDIQPDVSDPWFYTPGTPYSLNPAQVVTVEVSSLGPSVVAKSFKIFSNCAPTIPEVVPPVTPPEDCPVLVISDVTVSSPIPTSASFTINNTNPDVDATVVLMLPETTPGWNFTPDAPLIIPAGGSVGVIIGGNEDKRSRTFTVYTSCNSVQGTTPVS